MIDVMSSVVPVGAISSIRLMTFLPTPGRFLHHLFAPSKPWDIIISRDDASRGMEIPRETFTLVLNIGREADSLEGYSRNNSTGQLHRINLSHAL